MPDTNISGNLNHNPTPAAETLRPRVSVALALCNGARFLREQLKSIFDQKLVPDEIVISDDASEDASEEIVNEFAALHPGVIKYFKRKFNLGAAKNFESAISAATGDIILLSDQDDVWQREKISKLVQSIVSAPRHPAGAFCNSILAGENLQMIPCTHWDLREFENAANFTGFDQLEQCCRIAPVAGHNIAFEKELKEILLPFPNLENVHDNWIALVIAALGNWNVVPANLTLFRQHNDNLSDMLSAQSAWDQARFALENKRDEWNYQLYAALLDRMAQFHGKFPFEATELVAARKKYSDCRRKMSRNFFRRIGPVFRLWRSGAYRKFGRGWKNVVQDLFLRSFFG